VRAIALATAVAVLIALRAAPIRADASSMLEDSTVIGQNRGFPSGTPAQGHTPIGTVDLVTEVSMFLQNIEKLQDVPGRTFIGFLMPLRFRYRAHQQVTFELGAVLGQEFGRRQRAEQRVAARSPRLGARPVLLPDRRYDPSDPLDRRCASRGALPAQLGRGPEPPE